MIICHAIGCNFGVPTLEGLFCRKHWELIPEKVKDSFTDPSIRVNSHAWFIMLHAIRAAIAIRTGTPERIANKRKEECISALSGDAPPDENKRYYFGKRV